jgi:hypothetical protein
MAKTASLLAGFRILDADRARFSRIDADGDPAKHAKMREKTTAWR